jgi:hypothetical protein
MGGGDDDGTESEATIMDAGNNVNLKRKKKMITFQAIFCFQILQGTRRLS